MLASALYLSGGQSDILFVANDVIWVPKATVISARRRIAERTSVAADRIMVTATHTHSGPVITRMLSNESDSVVPDPDPEYLRQLEDGIVEAATVAVRSARPASLGFAVADGSAVGTNRHDLRGPAIPRVPVLVARDAQTGQFLGVMAVCSMHPTVLHEDSTQISGDLPGLARRHLKQHFLGDTCPFIYHMGAAGNQSPRHVARANTFEEAARLGKLLAESIVTAARSARAIDTAAVTCRHALIDLPLRDFPDTKTAASQARAALHRLNTLRDSSASRTDVRTAEVDWFGAEETLALTNAAQQGRVRQIAETFLPAEVQVICLGNCRFVGWPCEIFVEFALEVMQRYENTFIISLANGELQGYLVTQEAIDRGAYEAGNSLLRSPESGQRLVETTIKLLDQNAASSRVIPPCRTS